MRLARIAVSLTACVVLVSCGAGGSSGPTGSASTASPQSPATSEAASPSPSQTTVTPIPTPPTSSARVHELSWREYFGAYVPGGQAGPMRTSRFSASGWSHDEAGAVFAAAHFAVAADARQPAKIWKPAIKAAVPAGKRAKTAMKFKKAHDVAPPGEFDEQPFAAWRPNIRVVGYTTASVGGNRARVRVWARDDGGSWHTRGVRLAWADGDWRLDVSKKLRKWEEKSPPDDMVAYSTV